MENKNDISILVISCDKYSNIWPIFNKGFSKFWPKNPLKIYWASNYKSNKNNVFEVHDILYGEDSDYSSNLLKILESINEEFILLWIDDAILSHEVDNNHAINIINTAIEDDLNYLKLSAGFPVSYNSKLNSERLYGELPPGIKYRVGIGLSLYKKTFLQSILKVGESAWDFEKNVSHRINSVDKICAFNSKFNSHPFKFFHLVVKGKWNSGTKSFLKKLGLSHYLSQRQSISIFLRIYIYLSS